MNQTDTSLSPQAEAILKQFENLGAEYLCVQSNDLSYSTLNADLGDFNVTEPIQLNADLAALSVSYLQAEPSSNPRARKYSRTRLGETHSKELQVDVGAHLNRLEVKPISNRLY